MRDLCTCRQNTQNSAMPRARKRGTGDAASPGDGPWDRRFVLMLLPDESKEAGDGGSADLSGSLLRGLREMCRGSWGRGELWVCVLGAGIGKMGWSSAEEAGKRLDEHLVRGQQQLKQEAAGGDSDDPGRWDSDNVMDLLKCVHRQRLVDVVWMLPESPCAALDPQSMEGCKMYRALRIAKLYMGASLRIVAHSGCYGEGRELVDSWGLVLEAPPIFLDASISPHAAAAAALSPTSVLRAELLVPSSAPTSMYSSSGRLTATRAASGAADAVASFPVELSRLAHGLASSTGQNAAAAAASAAGCGDSGDGCDATSGSSLLQECCLSEPLAAPVAVRWQLCGLRMVHRASVPLHMVKAGQSSVVEGVGTPSTGMMERWRCGGDAAMLCVLRCIVEEEEGEGWSDGLVVGERERGERKVNKRCVERGQVVLFWEGASHSRLVAVQLEGLGSCLDSKQHQRHQRQRLLLQGGSVKDWVEGGVHRGLHDFLLDAWSGWSKSGGEGGDLERRGVKGRMGWARGLGVWRGDEGEGKETPAKRRRGEEEEEEEGERGEGEGEFGGSGLGGIDSLLLSECARIEEGGEQEGEQEGDKEEGEGEVRLNALIQAGGRPTSNIRRRLSDELKDALNNHVWLSGCAAAGGGAAHGLVFDWREEYTETRCEGDAESGEGGAIPHRDGQAGQDSHLNVRASRLTLPAKEFARVVRARLSQSPILSLPPYSPRSASLANRPSFIDFDYTTSYPPEAQIVSPVPDVGCGENFCIAQAPLPWLRTHGSDPCPDSDARVAQLEAAVEKIQIPRNPESGKRIVSTRGSIFDKLPHASISSNANTHVVQGSVRKVRAAGAPSGRSIDKGSSSSARGQHRGHGGKEPSMSSSAQGHQRGSRDGAGNQEGSRGAGGRDAKDKHLVAKGSSSVSLSVSGSGSEEHMEREKKRGEGNAVDARGGERRGEGKDTGKKGASKQVMDGAQLEEKRLLKQVAASVVKHKVGKQHAHYNELFNMLFEQLKHVNRAQAKKGGYCPSSVTEERLSTLARNVYDEVFVLHTRLKTIAGV